MAALDECLKNNIGTIQFLFSKNGDEYRWDGTFEFHQSYGTTNIIKFHKDDQMGIFNMILDEETGIARRFGINNGHQDITSMDFFQGKNKNRFIKVGNVQEYINNKLLEGEYLDDNGNIYKFDKGQLAVWPKKTFKYEINLDLESTSCDYVKELNEKGLYSGALYSFELKNENLYLYEAKTPEKSDFVKRSDKPFVILKRKN